MNPLHSHRTTRLLAFGWFLFTLIVAAASPLVHPQRIDIVCSSAIAGAIKVVLHTDSGPVDMGHGVSSLDCPLCLPALGPTALFSPSVPQLPPLSFDKPLSSQSLFGHAQLFPPARGPPFFA